MNICKHIAFLIVCVGGVFVADSTTTANGQEMVSVWVSEVQSAGDTDGSRWDVLGRFSSYQEASACSVGWSNLHPNSLRLTREREIKVAASKLRELLENTTEAKQAVDKAKEITKKGLTAKERKLGDTIKEYKSQIKESWNRAVNAKRQLTSMTGQLTVKQFNDVNKLIASFNQQYDSAEKQGWSLSEDGIQRIQPVNAEGSRKYTVLVYQQQGGQWIKNDSRSIVSNDLEAVQGYVIQVKRVRDWTATTNAPEKKESLDLKPKNELAQDESGQWDLFTGFYSSSGSKHGTYSSKAAAIAAGDEFVAANPGKQAKYFVKPAQSNQNSSPELSDVPTTKYLVWTQRDVGYPPEARRLHKTFTTLEEARATARRMVSPKLRVFVQDAGGKNFTY